VGKNIIFPCLANYFIVSFTYFLCTVYRYRKVYNKRTKTWNVIAERVPKDYNYIGGLQEKVVQACIDDQQHISRKRGLKADDPRKICSTIAAMPAPPTSELVARHRTRYGSKVIKVEESSSRGAKDNADLE
jgi:hypothetical protein